MKRHILRVSMIVLIVALPFGAVVLAYHHGYLRSFPDPAKQVELLAVYLAAATLAVTIAAIAIAVFGAIGYTTIKNAAVEAARIAGAEAGERAIQPILQRERLASGLDVGAQAAEGALDPLTSALAPPEAEANDRRPV